LRVVTKPIYNVEHISLIIETKFPIITGVGVVISIMYKLWLSEKVRKT